MNSLEECSIIINNIVQDTMVILKRPDPIQKQHLIELAIDFNEKLGQVNEETLEILKDKSWRNQ